MSTDSDDENMFICFWRIQNFSFLNRDGEDIHSPVFKVYNSEWKLGLRRNTAGYLTSVFLNKCSQPRYTKLDLFSIYFVHADKSELCVYAAGEHDFLEGTSSEATLEDLPILEQESCVQDGALTVLCYMWKRLNRGRGYVRHSIVTRLENDMHFLEMCLGVVSLWIEGKEFSFSLSCTSIKKTVLDMEVSITVVKNRGLKIQIRKINEKESSIDYVDCKIMAKSKWGCNSKLGQFRAKFLQEMQNDRGFTKHLSTTDLHFELNLIFEFLIPAENDSLSINERNWSDAKSQVCEICQNKPVVINKETQTVDKEEDNELTEGDLLRLFSEKKIEYVTLRTANKEFAVHKALLCARSPVFSAMFNINMKENDSNAVDIDDIDGDTLSLLLRFLQFEPLGDLVWDKAAKLYYAAEKYQIDPLKTKCSHLLSSELSEENVCSAFILAETYNDESLKHASLEFFCTNSKAILCSEEWKDFVRSKAEVAIEVLQVLAKKIKV